MSEPTETPYAEDGTYGVVGGRGLVTPSYPICMILFPNWFITESTKKERCGFILFFLMP